MQDAVNTEVVGQIVESIFSTMLNLDVQPVETPPLPGGDRMTSSVFLEGDWNGAISLECNRQQACAFAGYFLSMTPPESVDDDVRDVLGELANMIGGNVKSLIPGEIRLSMPAVIDGHDYALRVCGSAIEDRLGFRFDGGIFWIRVLGGKTLRRETSTLRDTGHRSQD